MNRVSSPLVRPRAGRAERMEGREASPVALEAEGLAKQRLEEAMRPMEEAAATKQVGGREGRGSERARG